MSASTKRHKNVEQSHKHLLFLVNCGKCMGIGIVWGSTCRTKSIQILADMMPAPHTHSVPTRTRVEILICQIHLLNTQWAHLGLITTLTHCYNCYTFISRVCLQAAVENFSCGTLVLFFLRYNTQNYELLSNTPEYYRTHNLLGVYESTFFRSCLKALC